MTTGSPYIQGVFSKEQVNKGIKLVIKEGGSDFQPILLKAQIEVINKLLTHLISLYCPVKIFLTPIAA